MARSLRSDAQRNRQRILEAAEVVFALKGPSASTEEIAQKAGVGIGTVFRHFPTKEALLQAIIEVLAVRVAAETGNLARTGEPATAFFEFFTWVIGQAAEQRTVVDLLAEAGVEVTVAKPVDALRDSVAALLAGAQRAGAVRRDVGVPEVLALLIGLCQASLHAGWSPEVRDRTLAVVFDGLRPSPAAESP
ncbi:MULTISPECIES: TetR/AcrR family transcriptional regulator [Microbispora]|uniref:TetR/AcrR family transcriptional regulator n=2 Tax=Microbispora TaxID=2005 RepID=A0A5J5JSW7_9ACTN|nr:MULTISPECIES: TetR/AcrR family transcriptional regulator [Microbispora]KAA9373157.1 TetR/AcrR family transcriptional regulator [Microbispora cellulosiformans]GIH36986.1 TetR family transcriptional regulator [Microbispora amethystogenes]